MNDTPETDDQPIIYALNDNGYQVPCVDLEFARKLERERDEARAVAYDLAAIASHCLGWHDHESAKAADRITSVLKKWKELKQ
jgi:hypothetical protein